MKPTHQTKFLLLFSVAGMIIFSAFNSSSSKTPEKPAGKQKIQAAILLDVSNSMDGLIDQAKAQLWNMVSVMGRAKCGNAEVPDIEIALYEYGRTNNPVSAGYVKQICSFTNDLDSLSKALFALTTNGGDEYCGQVIYTSLNDLTWDSSPGNYKVIFISGNEDFLQGNLPYTKACALAKEKGVIVNTIYCGDRMSGIREHWNLNAECGTGSFTNIDQNQKVEDIPTPYDSAMFTLNNQLNITYVGYGAMGGSKMQMQKDADGLNEKFNKSTAVKRIAVKGKKELYKNDSWDLVDAAAAPNGEQKLKNIPKAALPDSLRNKSDKELKEFVAVKSKERSAIQSQIEELNTKRENYLVEERKKRANTHTEANLETAMEKAIKEQAKRFNMVID